MGQASHKRIRALYEVIRHVRPLHRELARMLHRELEGTGITVGMRAIMEVLDELGPTPVPGIARTLRVPRQSVQRTVNVLTEEKLVERRENHAHRRSPRITLTKKGTSTFQKIRAREDEVLADVVKKLPAGEIEACLHVVEVLHTAFAVKNAGA